MAVKSEKQKKIRVFLVDDHPIVRDGVRSYLASRDIAVVGEAADAPEALRKVKKLSPDVIVLDVNLPSMVGWEVALCLRRLVPKSRIIAFSIHSSEEYVVKMAQTGARGYVMKSQPTSELLEAIKQVSLGGRYFPAGMTDAMLAAAPKSSPKRPDSKTLTSHKKSTPLRPGLKNGAAKRAPKKK